MATRSSITVQVADGKFKSVYCHWDGYPSNNGRLLLDHYNTLDKAEALVDLGDISNLDETIDCPDGHSYSTPAKGCTVFYGRDRGETGVETTVADSLDEARKGNHQEYNYLFINGKWEVDGEDLVEVVAKEEI